MNCRIVLFFVFFADVVLQQDQIKTLALLTQPQAPAGTTSVCDVLDLVDGGDASIDVMDEGVAVELDAKRLVVTGNLMTWPPDPAALQALLGARPVDLRIARDTAFERYWQLRTALGAANVRVLANP